LETILPANHLTGAKKPSLQKQSFWPVLETKSNQNKVITQTTGANYYLTNARKQRNKTKA